MTIILISIYLIENAPQAEFSLLLFYKTFHIKITENKETLITKDKKIATF